MSRSSTLLQVVGLGFTTLTASCGLGCNKPRVVFQRVEVPVAVPCPPPPPREPLHLPVEDLPKGATPDQQARAIKASILYLLGRVNAAEALLDAYRPAPVPPLPATSPKPEPAK